MTSAPMASEQDALEWIDKDGESEPSLAVMRRLEHMLGIPAMYSEWADPDCTICHGRGETGGAPCLCTVDDEESNEPRD